jgi:diguanylate cyclase (GGDEF)-like protein
VPWGLKEATAVAILIYTLFTASSVAVAGRFDIETLWTLQFLFVASSAIALSLVARNVRVRKHDIETRFDLEQAQRRHEHLSLTDPLTGAFNRRYLDRYYGELVAEAQSRDQKVYLALLDIDQFKPLNDTFGHHAGDEILKHLVDILTKNLPGNCVVVRLGGDEFAVVFVGEKVQETIAQCLKHLATDPAVLRATQGQPVGVSSGFSIAADGDERKLQDVYRAADKELYATKRRRKQAAAGAGDGELVIA